MFLPLMLLCTCTNHAFKYCQNMWNEHRILYQETIKLSFVVCRTLAFERVRFFNESSHVTPKLGSQVDQTGLLKLHTACLCNSSIINRSYTTYTKKLGPSSAWISNIESKKYRSLLSTTKMVCGPCFLRCRFKNHWHGQLDLAHERLTKSYQKLENLQIFSRTIPILVRDESRTGRKIKALKRAIDVQEDVVDNINMCLDFDTCRVCASCTH